MFFSKSARLGVLFAVLLLSFGSAAGQKRPAARTSAAAAVGQKASPVKQIDNAGLRKALTPADGKPLLVNFWATWCDPCREEFPDLVKLDAEYKGKIDFITISLDEVADINGPVTKFLSDMKATMPAYLLAVQDDDAAIAIVSKDFTGALPFTILYDAAGNQAYIRQGKVSLETVRAELAKVLGPAPSQSASPSRR